MTKFLFDKKEAEDNLKLAVERGCTLIEFSVVLDSDGKWKPYTRIVPKDMCVPSYCTVVMDSSQVEDIKIQTKAINTSDFYTEVIDAAWFRKVA